MNTHRKSEGDESQNIAKKENQDIPNIQAANDKVDKEQPAEKQIRHSSWRAKSGKTDNIDRYIRFTF